MTGRRLLIDETGIPREHRERIRQAVDREARRSFGLFSIEEFLRDELEHGPRLFDELAEAARRQGYGFTRAALRTAARRIGVVGRDGHTWSLPTSGPDDR